MKYELIGFILGIILSNIIGWFVYFRYVNDHGICAILTSMTTFALVIGSMKIGNYIDKRRNRKK